MFSKSCEYGIRAMIYVAKANEPGKKISIRNIAKGIAAPVPFTAKILQELSKKGLIQSTKGPGGGFYFEKNALNINIADVVEALDGDQLFTQCGLGLSECSEKTPCPIHFEFKAIREQIRKMLQNVQLLNFNENQDLVLNFIREKQTSNIIPDICIGK